MKKIGILSDTHGMLRAEVLEALKGCECIFHAGDINKKSILDELEKIAPVYVVRGNNDKEWAEYIPESLTVEVHGLRIFMIHNKKYIPKDLTNIDLIIYGHSHKYEEKELNGIRALNPGSCGPRRFNQDITLALLNIQDDGSFSVGTVLLSSGASPVSQGVSPCTENVYNIHGTMIAAIMKEIGAGKTVKQIAKKHKISEELAEQITRMYLTHPGVDVEGIMRRIGL